MLLVQIKPQKYRAIAVRELSTNVAVRPTVEISKLLVTVPWRSIGFYPLTGTSVITFKEKLVKETIAEVLEEIRQQNPVAQILLIADNDGGHQAYLIQQRIDKLGIDSSPFLHTRRTSMQLNRSGRSQTEDFARDI